MQSVCRDWCLPVLWAGFSVLREHRKQRCWPHVKKRVCIPSFFSRSMFLFPCLLPSVYESYLPPILNFIFYFDPSSPQFSSCLVSNLHNGLEVYTLSSFSMGLTQSNSFFGGNWRILFLKFKCICKMWLPPFLCFNNKLAKDLSGHFRADATQISLDQNDWKRLKGKMI